MEKHQIERVADNAYFVYLSGVSCAGILTYDPRVTQVYLHDYESVQEPEAGEVVEVDEEDVPVEESV